MASRIVSGRATLTNRQAGFTLLGLILLIAVLGIGLAALGVMWHTASQREKEKELLFIGDQYRQAIESFWRLSPSGIKRLPKNFEELLVDPRFPNTVRHLRRIYRDPMTNSLEWGLVKDTDEGIYGVHSLSDKQPFKSSGFAQHYAYFEGAKSYREWLFKIDHQSGQSHQKPASARKPTINNQPQPIE